MSLRDQKALEHFSETGSSKSGQSGNQRNTVHLTQQKRCVFWGYIALLTIFFAGMLVMAVSAWEPMQSFSSSDDFYFANQVAYQWTQGFVDDIIITSDVDCPSGYKHAIQFEWPGTGFGCFCSTGQNVSFVLEGYCSPSLIQSNCVNMPNQETIISNKWKNSSSICMRRSSVSFATESKYDNSGNYQLCGSSRSLVIIPNTEPCPLVNISFSTFPLENNTKSIIDTDSLLPPLFAAFNSTSPFSFYSYPISKFSVSEFQFCLIDEDTGIDPGHSDFILINNARGCLQVGNYSTLDSQNEIQFYANNPTQNALSNNPGFPNASNWQYFLGFANMPGWTYECRHNYDNKFSIPNARSILNFQYFSSYAIMMIVMIFLVGGVGVQVFLLVIRRCFNSSIYPTGYKQRYLPIEFGYAITRYIVDAVFKTGIIALCFYMTWTSYVQWNWFKGVANFNCYDSNRQIEQMIITPYTDLYLLVMQLSLGMSVSTVVMVIIDITHFVFIYKHELQYYLLETEGKAIIKPTEEDDLKWMNSNGKDNVLVENIQDRKEDDQFKITMSQNLFGHEEEEPVRIQRPGVKKKKKKRGGLIRRVIDGNSEELKQEDSIEKSGFNPYDVDDSALFNLDSSISSPKKESESLKKRRKR